MQNAYQNFPKLSYFRKVQASDLAIPDDQARKPNHVIQLLQQTPECSLILLAFLANLIEDVPNQSDPAISSLLHQTFIEWEF